MVNSKVFSCEAFVNDLRCDLIQSVDNDLTEFLRASSLKVSPSFLPSYVTLEINSYCCAFLDTTLDYHSLLSIAENCCRSFYYGFKSAGSSSYNKKF